MADELLLQIDKDALPVAKCLRKEEQIFVTPCFSKAVCSKPYSTTRAKCSRMARVCNENAFLFT